MGWIFRGEIWSASTPINRLLIVSHSGIISGYCTRSELFKYVFIYSFLILKSIYLYFKIKPQIVVTTGSHTVVPMCYIAKLFKKKIIYIETFANINRKSLTGKIIYPIANLFIVQWKSMLKLYSKAIYIGRVDSSWF